MTTCIDCGQPTLRGPCAKRCASCHHAARKLGKFGRNVVVRFVSAKLEPVCVLCRMPTGRARNAKHCWACAEALLAGPPRARART